MQEKFAPGTVLLEDAALSTGHGDGHLVFLPQPSEDPNDPLNWTNRRKYVNFAIISFYAFLIFTILDIGPVAWQTYVDDLGISWDELNITFASNCAGLAVGCIIFIPFALKYGRRPVYIISTAITFAMAIWQAKLNTFWEMVVTQVISGLSGAVSETLVQMTVADMFFIHQRGTMNGIYLMMVAIGTFLSPVASGLIADSQGWRWMYWYCTILFGVNLMFFLFGYEETKFTHKGDMELSQIPPTVIQEGEKYNETNGKASVDNSQTAMATPFRGINHSIPLRSYRQRLAFTTPTESSPSKLLRHTYQPFIILFTIPAVAYGALLYGSLLAWFSILTTTEATYFSLPPYNFGATGIGLMQLPAFIGCVLGFLWGGILSDWSIVWSTKRNSGVYEPEMRLYLATLPALLGPVGLFLYGYSTAAGMHWIVPCIGIGLFGFAVTALGDASLTYLTDSYREILGDSLVAVAFLRNALATAVVFALDPWLDDRGLHGVFTCVGCLSIGLNMLILPLIFWGKRLRVLCAGNYERMARKQFDARKI